MLLPNIAAIAFGVSVTVSVVSIVLLLLGDAVATVEAVMLVDAPLVRRPFWVCNPLRCYRLRLPLTSKRDGCTERKAGRLIEPAVFLFAEQKSDYLPAVLFRCEIPF